MNEQAQKETQKETVNKNIMPFTSKSGKKYTFQKVMPIAWLDIMDDVEAGDRKTQRRRLYGHTLDNIVVQPKTQLEEWEDFGELDEVVTAAIRFQRGE